MLCSQQVWRVQKVKDEASKWRIPKSHNSLHQIYCFPRGNSGFLGTSHLTAHRRLLSGFIPEGANSDQLDQSVSQKHRRKWKQHHNGIAETKRERAYNAPYIHIQTCPALGKIHECCCVGVNLQFIRTRVVACPPETEGHPQPWPRVTESLWSPNTLGRDSNFNGSGSSMLPDRKCMFRAVYLT